jgi:hypothetical protein
MLVDRTPQQVRFATQRDEHLVEAPCATRLASRRFDPVSEALAKLIAPASDCLVCHGHTALEQQFLDVAQAQLKAEIPAHGATDDAGWKTVSVIERFRFLHHAILRDRASNLTTPSPQQIRLATQRHKHFVKMPCGAGLTASSLHAMSKARAKLVIKTPP